MYKFLLTFNNKSHLFHAGEVQTLQGVAVGTRVYLAKNEAICKQSTDKAMKGL